MAASIIDSSIFQGIFSTDAMRAVWSDENRTQKYLDIERALAKVQGRLGLIPQEAADEIVSPAHVRFSHFEVEPPHADRHHLVPGGALGFDEVSLGLDGPAEASRCFCARTLRRLRSILSEDQRKAVGI